ncbi:MAG: HAD family hydrolase [Lachnospirales bacterium]
MVKLIACDLDGTLIHNNMISSINKGAIKRFENSGGRFVVSTGRDFNMAMEVTDLSCDYICANGACVYENGKLVYKITMPREDLEKIINISKENCVIDLFTNKGIYNIGGVEKFKKDFKEVEEIIDEHGSFFGESDKEKLYYKMIGRRTFREFKDLEDDIEVYKVFLQKFDINEIKKLREDFSVIKTINIDSSFMYNIELTNINATKGKTVKAYAESKNIKMEEVMIIGDGENDLSMLSMDFGFTVAMGNAEDSIKKAAKYTTIDCVDNGVAHAIEKYALKSF